jgi:hypothetical protein
MIEFFAPYVAMIVFISVYSVVMYHSFKRK